MYCKASHPAFSRLYPSIVLAPSFLCVSDVCLWFSSVPRLFFPSPYRFTQSPSKHVCLPVKLDPKRTEYKSVSSCAAAVQSDWLRTWLDPSCPHIGISLRGVKGQVTPFYYNAVASTCRKKKSKGTKKKTPKVSQSKLANKKASKLAKQGKLKTKKQKKKLSYLHRSGPSVPGKQPHDHLMEEEEEDNEEGEDQNGFEEEDIEFYGTPEGHSSFIKSAASSRLLDTEDVKSKKRKKVDSIDDEEEFEKVPRKLFANDKMKQLLPIKTKQGIVPQSIAVEDIQNGFQSGQELENGSGEPEIDQSDHPDQPEAKVFANKHEKMADFKQRIAVLSYGVIENPQEGMRKLKELRLMLDEADQEVYLTVRKLVMVSLMEIFKDIVPGYRIRLPTDSEKQIKVKKETKTLRDYEASFLMNYRSYLEFLERTCKGEKNQKKWHLGASMPIPPQALKAMKLLALRCLSELLVTHPHFNYRTNIIVVLVPFMNNQDKEISKLACDAIRKVFREDKLGEASLEIVRNISKMVKVRESRIKREVLDAFLSLRIKQVDFDGEITKQSGKEKKEMMKKMSRRERKRKKKMEYLEKELLETKATEDKNRKIKLHTDVIESVFYTYFRILKGDRKSALLSPVLEGLAKFAHLINIDFFDDLFKVFNELIDSGDLTYRESLHCVQTAFTILSGQGSVLNIDPMRFYVHLYNSFFKVHAGHSSEDVPIILDCVDCMLGRRKRQVSQQRVLAFAKRLGTLCLQQTAPASLALLGVIRGFLGNYKVCELLFDNDTQGSGTFLPELPDPEHCNSHNTMLWELGFLQHHYHPVVKKYANHVSKLAPSTGDGQLSSDLVRKSPHELLQEFTPISDEQLFIPCPAEKTKVKRKYATAPGSFVQSEINDFVSRVLPSVNCDLKMTDVKKDLT
ncbi:hypothetical protein FSP39_009879 [Pinctada imbricata]|uniref:NOC3-like protein n=1 Tax=Pinctada imbricata TaxID=66713 RepID=A0AA88Y343_PINIB|nr:hypothetical protein FSP39_009879 [Pinctada imbricata]